MLDKIAKLDAYVIRGVLAAVVPVLSILLNALFGLDEKLFTERAGQLIESVMALWAALALAYIAYARIAKPTPPLSDTAVEKTQQMLAAGKLSVTPVTPTATPERTQ